MLESVLTKLSRYSPSGWKVVARFRSASVYSRASQPWRCWLDSGLHHSLLEGLSCVGILAASLASAHQMPVALHPLSR